MQNGKQKDFSWKIGDQITFEVESGLFEGTFTSEIVGINPRQGIIQIKFPKLEGKLVLIPVGTAALVKTDNPQENEERYTVIDRTGGETRCLVLKKCTKEVNQLIHINPPQDIKLVSVCSGKGGVGKTTFAINLAFSLADLGHRVCILDAAFGTGNIDVLLDIAPRFHIGHVISGKCGLMDIVTEVKQNLHILPGCSGVQPLTQLSYYEYNLLAFELEQIFPYFDVIIIDTSPGIAAGTTNFILAAQGGYLITTPEPHAITDTYALLKTLVSSHPKALKLSLVVNRVLFRSEAENTAEKLQFAARRFLDFELDCAGFIFEDPRIRYANVKQKAIVELEPASQTSQNFRAIAKQFAPQPPASDESRSQGGLIAKIKSFGKRA